MQKKLEEDE